MIGEMENESTKFSIGQEVWVKGRVASMSRCRDLGDAVYRIEVVGQSLKSACYVIEAQLLESNVADDKSSTTLKGRETTMMLRRWNYETHEYDPYEVPDEWNVSTRSPDMDMAYCASCGVEIGYDSCYVSKEIRTSMGLGTAICLRCLCAELDRKIAADWEQQEA